MHCERSETVFEVELLIPDTTCGHYPKKHCGLKLNKSGFFSPTNLAQLVKRYWSKDPMSRVQFPFFATDPSWVLKFISF